MAPITINKTLYKVSDFLSWQKSGTLILSPNFQRNSVWKPGTKSYFLDTIVRGLPIPIIFLRDQRVDLKTFEPRREVVDGQQRLRTVIAYVAPGLLNDFEPRDDFIIKKTHNSEIGGRRFDELTPDIKRRILEYEFNVHILSSDVGDREVLQIFRRMNSSNYTLLPQELRNAEWFGEFKTSMYTLAEEQLSRWRDKWKTFTIDDIARMNEVELTSELAIAMIDKKISSKSKSRIDKAYMEFDEVFEHRNEIEKRFRAVMDTIDEKLGDNLTDFPFLRKTMIYSLFINIYDILFGLTSNLKRGKIHSISQGQVDAIIIAGEKIHNKSAPQSILEAASRRTTNIKERKIYFDYIFDHIKNQR